MRYTECKMAPLSMEMVRDITENTVDFKPNYDNREMEPIVLPARFPNLLVNGSTGIAVGMATNIPTHNLREVAAAVQWALEHPEATKEELLEAAMERIKGPDFPNGALIVGRKGIEDAYRTGRGSVIMRAVIDIEEDKAGRTLLVVTELPHMCNPDNLADEDRRAGQRRQADRHRRHPRRHVGPHRPAPGDRAEARRPAARRDEQPVQAHPAAGHLRLQHAGPGRRRAADAAARPVHQPTGCKHQIQVIQRRTAYRLDEAEKQAHIYRGLVKALDRLDEVIALIRALARRRGGPRGPEGPAGHRRGAGHCHPEHAAAPAGRPGDRSRSSTGWPRPERLIADLKDILAKPERQRQIIASELAEIVDKYGDERRTRIIAADGDLSDEDFIPDDDMVVTITRGGYAKRTRTDLYRVQKRGGKGVRGATLRADDEVEHLFATTNHHWILFFTNLGRVYRAKVWQLPEAGRDAKGGHVAGLLSFLPEERIAEVLTLRSYDDAPVPAAGHQQRAGEEDRAAGVRLAAAGRRDRGQLPRGRRRADRRGAVQRGRRRAADLAEGPGDPVRCRRRAAASDGTGDVRRDRNEVPRRRTRC